MLIFLVTWEEPFLKSNRNLCEIILLTLSPNFLLKNALASAINCWTSGSGFKIINFFHRIRAVFWNRKIPSASKYYSNLFCIYLIPNESIIWVNNLRTWLRSAIFLKSCITIVAKPNVMFRKSSIRIVPLFLSTLFMTSYWSWYELNSES